MYTYPFVRSLQKADAVVFPQAAYVITADFQCSTHNFFACSYIYNDGFCPDPDVCIALQQTPFKGEYYLALNDRVERAVTEAIKGRPHIKSGVVISSMTTKAVWHRVWTEIWKKKPLAMFDDFRLSAEDMAYCLPSGFEFPDTDEDIPTVDVIRNYFRHEIEVCYRELEPGAQAIYKGATQQLSLIDRSVEVNVLSQVAVRCNGEQAMFNFLKACRELVLAELP